MKNILIYIVLFCFPLQFVFGQTDTEFWFAAPEVTLLHADRPIFLRISTTDVSAKVTISQPANAGFPIIQKTIGANGFLSIDLTEYIDLLENDLPDQVMNKGLHIVSTAGITAYYEVIGNGNNAEIFVLKGNHGLGKDFFMPAQTYWQNHDNIDAWCSFDIVASEDNTTITINPTQNVYGHEANVSYTIELDKGQTYSIRADSIIGIFHPTGTHITSDKKVAITYKDDSLWDQQHWDLVGDQMVPSEMVGSRYIAIKMSDTSNTDRLFFAFTKPETEVAINGVKQGPFAPGDTLDYHLLSPTAFIESSQPVYIFHIGGFRRELGGALLQPLGCTGSRKVSFVRSTNETFKINILVKSFAVKYFQLNGNPVPSSFFEAVPGTGNQYSFASIPANALVGSQMSAVVTNDSADFQLATLNGGISTGFRYGYFSDYGFLTLGGHKSFCEGSSITLTAGSGNSGYVWTNFLTGDTLSRRSYLSIADSGIYKVSIAKDTCSFSDTVHVSEYPGIHDKILGNDTAVCNNVTLRIPTLNKFEHYLWNNGDTLSFIQTGKAGNYSVTVKNIFGCAASDTLQLIIYELPKPAIFYDQNFERYCMDSTFEMSSDMFYPKYKWSSGDTTSTIHGPHQYPEKFSLTVTDVHGCQGQSFAEVDCSPFLGPIPNLLTLNQDGKNEAFSIPYLQPGFWTLEVYNRWGSRVYQEKDYRNNWSPEGIDDSVYYYLLRHQAGKKEVKGWLEVVH